MKTVKTSELSKEFLINRVDPCYPPHHTGDHLEEAFLKFWQSEGNGHRKLIPVHWTAVYNHKVKEGLGPGTPNQALRNDLKRYLNSLDKNEKYFVVATHDDAPAEDLPPNTIVFAAGGNSKKIDYAIPLTCGPHQIVDDPLKTIPCSFVGSMTHPIRQSLLSFVHNKPGVLVQAFEWQETVSEQKADIFKKITQKSIFSLCPRGYGATSYRLYEALQLGAIPVYVSDKHLLPWNDELNWKDFCVLVNTSQISSTLDLTLNLPNKKVREMQSNIENLWDKHFSIEATCKHILKRVK
jgi:hypothetical protein